MAAVAQLGVEVKAKGVKEADAELKSFASSAKTAETAADKLTSRNNALTGSFASMTGPLGRVAAMLVGAFSVGSIVKLGDEWSDLTSRVNLASGSIEKGTEVMGRLQKMANATYSSLRTTTEGYIANATTLRGMGKSTKDTLDYTEALNNAMVVSGARAERAASVQNALSKAMALGKLSGDNLNTVISNGGRVAELLAEKLNTTVPGLIAMGTQGKITGDIITSSLIGNMQRLAEEAESMPATVGDAFQRMQNNVLSTVGSFDQMFGASETMAGALLAVADNIDRIIITTSSAALAFGTYYVGSLTAAAIATGGLTGALTLLRRALIASGVGAFIVLIGEAVYQLLEARKATGSWGQAFAEIAKRIEKAMQGLRWTFHALIDSMKAAWSQFMAFMITSTEKAMSSVYKAFGATFGGFGNLANEQLLDAKDHMANAADQFSIAGDYFKEALASFDTGTSIDLSGDAGSGMGALGGAGSGGGGGARKGGGGNDRTGRDMESRLEALKQSLAGENEARMQAYVKDMETLNWYLDNKKLSQEEYDMWKKRVEGEAFEKSLTDQELLIMQHQQELEALRMFFDQKKLTEEEYLRWQEEINTQHAEKMRALTTQQWTGALDSMGELMGAMASMQSSGNEKMLKAQRIFAAASALISTFEGAAKALTLPFPANLAAVATVIAKGMSLVAAIKSGSKSASGGGGGGTTASAAPAPTKPQQMAEIKIHGEVFGRDQVIDLVDKINDVQKDGHMINWSYA